MTISPNVPNKDTELSLLLLECQAQIKNYKKGIRGDSLSCLEIVRRSAKGDRDALASLLTFSLPIIREHINKKYAKLRPLIDDVIQEVNLRLIRKFRNPDSPFHPSTFAEFHVYVDMTVKSVALNMLRSNEQEVVSFDVMAEEVGSTFRTQNDESAHPLTLMMQEETWTKLFSLLDNPLEREVLQRRIRFNEAPDEIATALRLLQPGLTKQDIYRLHERALRRLKNNPMCQQILSS